MKAILKEALAKEGWYSYEKGTEFTIKDKRKLLTLVEDWLGFQHWIKTELFDFI